MNYYTDEPMTTIMNELSDALASKEPGFTISFAVLDPDLVDDAYAGTIYEVEGKEYIYRGYKAWTDLAQLLQCRMSTPKAVDQTHVEIRFKRLNVNASFHTAVVEDIREKYGNSSRFATIHKNEEPAFIHAYSGALKNVNITTRKRVLDLGVNRGDEFEVIERLLSPNEFELIHLVGIDHSHSAIKQAQERFPTQTFYQHDINRLEELDLGHFDLIISIGTLQSPGVEFKPLFHSLVQDYLEVGGAMILGFPNSRWMGGEMIYGAKMPNYRDSDLSLLVKDVYYCKKYLQQKRFKVRLTGRDYIFLTATKIH